VNTFDSWLDFVNKWPDWLRWLMVVPLGVATAAVWWLVITIIGVSIAFLGDEEERSAISLFAIFARVFLSTAFVLAGTFVAPRARMVVALGLSILILAGGTSLWLYGPSWTQASVVEWAIGIAVTWVWVAIDARKARLPAG
jgi:hypothetical protein